MRLRLERLIAKWTPSGLSPEESVRARFFVQAHLLGLVVVVTSSISYGAGGLWGQGVLTALMGLATVISLLVFRRTGWLRGTTRFSLAAATVSFAGAAITQTPVDVTNISFLAVIPLLASFTLGPRDAVHWVIIELPIGVTVMWLGWNGYTLSTVDHSPWLSQSFNFIFMAVLLWLFSRAYDSVQGRAFRELQQAHQAKTTFLATISHEIRTPMNGVLGLTEVLLAEQLTASQRENLTLIRRSGKLLVALINDLLDVTKAEAGKLSVEQYDFDLRRVLDDVRGLFEPVALKKGLRLEVALEPGTPTALRGDGMRLTQVLNNLVSNAVKFTERGTVVVRAKAGAAPSSVAFEVQDSGPGIAPALVPRLFTPFVQGDGSTTRRQGGSGLGLVLAQQLVTVMGGKIAVDSVSGQGSRFAFTLAFKPRVEAVLELTPPSGTPLRELLGSVVLVVDDNPINLVVAAQLVEKAGFRAVKVSSGRDALVAASAMDFAMILMDCHMPEMDGFETTARIRALTGRRATVPIVALTASATPEDLAACRRSGMNDVLVKPVTLPVLAAALARHHRAAQTS